VIIFATSFGGFAVWRVSESEEGDQPEDMAADHPRAPDDRSTQPGKQRTPTYWMTGVLGLGLVVAPFVMGYSGNTPALWTSIVIGVAVLAVSAIRAMRQEIVDWEYWAAGLLGLAAVVSPFVFHFRGLTPALWSELILGTTVSVLAGYRAFEDTRQRVHA
jgi:hypothetical protein